MSWFDRAREPREKRIIRIRPFSLRRKAPGNPLVRAGRSCDNCIVRNCEFIGVATDGQTEPTNESLGYLLSKENGQFATFLRTDHFTNDDAQMVDITVENCTFKYSYDAGIFFSNRAGGAGRVTLHVRDSLFDAFGKFQVGDARLLAGRGTMYFQSRVPRKSW